MRKIKNFIPHSFFIAQGSGESRHTHQSGSYHLALKDAGIGNQNIVEYNCVLPPESTEIEQPTNLRFGSMMNCIMSRCDGRKDEIITAGIAYGWLYDKNENNIGGIVVERSGNYDEETMQELLAESLAEIKNKSFSHFDMEGENYIVQSMIPNEQYGTVIVSLCFVDYLIDSEDYFDDEDIDNYFDEEDD